jgi:hypothetical protein
MLNEKVAYYIDGIKKGGYKRIVGVAENILLRPNDNKLFMGEEKFNALVEALEIILEDYKNDDIYKYYYELSKVEHGFCGFERWENGYLF